MVKLFCQIAIVVFIAASSISVRGDSTDGSTPLALKPGVPAGSYALSNLDNINTYNGSLNFRLPLLTIAGRGSAAYTMTLPIEQKWRINVTSIPLFLYQDGGGPPLPDPQITYLYFPSANWWSGIKPGYGPGVMQGRIAQHDAQVCSDSTMRATFTLTRLTFTAPDGTEFELRDRQTDGTPAGVGICDTNGFNRGRIFQTADGSAATFISDQNIIDYILIPNAGNDVFYPSGYLLMRDGMRYRFDNGTVSWLRDRNGNKMTFVYDSFKRVTTITDSLNRQVSISYATTGINYDEIIYKGFGGAQRTTRVNYAQLSDPGSLRAGYSPQTYYQLFPVAGTSTTGTYNPKIVRSVTLPNNQQYQFQYNPYGELARVVLPTGGAYEYDHDAASGTASGGVIGDGESRSIFRRIVTRRVYADGSTLTNKSTFGQQQSAGGNTSYVLIDQFGSDGVTRINQQKVYHEGFALNSLSLLSTDYSPWKEGREIQSESIAADGTTVLRRIAQTWQQPITGNSWPLTQAETNATARSNNPQVTQVLTTLEPGQSNKVAKQTFEFDKYTNRTDVSEYDFGAGVAGPFVRRSHTDYLKSSYDTLNPSSSSPDLNLTSHIRNLPTQVSVFDASGVERARTVSEYDNYALDGANCSSSYHCTLKARPNISGLDSLFDTSYTRRGNPTAVVRYLLSNGTVTGMVSAYSHYDVAGNIVRSIDPRSTPANFIATSIEYDDRYGVPNNEARANTAPSELAGSSSFAFATKLINPLGHTVYAQFDYYLGRTVNAEDANGIVASGYFDDPFDRPKQIRRGIGTAVESQTTFAYDDANRTVTTSSDRDANNDNLLVSKVLFDQMGRTIEARQYEGGANYISSQTQYDVLGRPFKTSNPFRPWQNESVVWTIQAFDSLGRVISVTTPDDAVVSTTYSGNSVTVTDQAGKARKTVTDALGRLREVYEDPGGFNYQTAYSYDVLDNLTLVTQGTQTRTFVYDSLKRLRSATNPENGTVNYTYDSNFNLTQKIDARGVVSNYSYDPLNRTTTIDYSDTASINPDLTRTYDGATNGVGRVWSSYAGGSESVGNNVDKTIIDSYDCLGRPLVLRQVFKLNGVWRPAYQTSRGYNRAGAVTSQIFPSGHSVGQNYDSAGRLADKDPQNLAFTGNLGDGVSRTYSRGLTYASAGQLQEEQFGTTTPVYNKRFYNSRQQLAEILVSTSGGDTSWNRGKILNQYSLQCSGVSCNATDNNGLVRKQEVFIPNNDPTTYTWWYQKYDYDGVNRLIRVHEYTANPLLDWQQEYQYDQWGNRRINTANTYGAGINNTSFEKQDTTNRLYSPGDLALADNLRRIRYDATGNQIKDNYTGYGSATFDAENHITAIQDRFANWSYYTYNADGHRTRTKVNNQETWQVYGFGGELLAEYPANGPVASPQKEYGYRNGQLLVTGEPGAAQQSTENVSWANIVGVSASGNSLTKTAADNWGNSGASSSQAIVAGDGYVQLTATETNTFRMIGLSRGDSNQDYTDIDFAAYLSAANLCIYETGISRGCISTYATGDTIRVAVESGVVKYRKNGSVVYTSSVSPSYPLVADSALWSNGSTINSAVISGMLSGSVPQNPQNVSWSGAVGISIVGNSITKTTADNWGNSGARSSQNISAGDGYVETTASETHTFRMIGLSNGDSNQDYTDIDFAAYLSAANFCIYEAGTSRGCVSTYATGDTIRVAVEGGVVKYRKNGVVVYTSGVAPSYPLLVDSAIWSNTATLNNVVISGNLSGGSGAGTNIRWLVSDHLGTPRMVLDQSGSMANMKRHDYLPFGEELFAPTGVRSTALSYASGDGLRQQFASKERDKETNLDYFHARHFSSTQGRFNSVDPINLTIERLYDPTRINLYSYCRNSPLSYVDPNGADLILANPGAQTRIRPNMDVALRENERRNIAVTGDRVTLVGRDAIDLTTASSAYKNLWNIITDSNAHRYFAVASGETATASDGVTKFSYSQVHQAGGQTVVYTNGDSDSFVPIAADMTVENESGDPILFPEWRSWWHEVGGHGFHREDRDAAIAFENAVAADLGFPLRSGRDHRPWDGRSPLHVNISIDPTPARTNSRLPKNFLNIRPLKPLLDATKP